MNKRRTIVLLALAALGGLLPAVAEEAAAEADAGMTLAEVLAAHYEAVGGTESWGEVESVRFSGTMTLGPGMEAPFSMTMKRPDKIRLEFTVQGMTGIQASDGETAWIVMPFMGQNDPEEMPGDLAKQLEQQADVDGPLFDWEAKGHKLELVGREEMEGTDVYKVKVTRESGDVRYHYLDERFFEIKQKGSTKVQGQEVEFETAIGDYKEVCLAAPRNGADCDGGALMLAHSFESKAKGAPTATQVITISNVAINPGDIEADFFAMPVKVADEAQSDG